MIIIRLKKQLSAFTLDVDMRCGRELVLVRGANGAGKTTLLRLIAGLEQPDAGRLVVCGQSYVDDTGQLPPHMRNVGYIAPASCLYPWLSVRQNILLGLRHGGQTDAGLDELAAHCGIGELLSRRPRSLSAGEAQRAMLVRALLRRPGMLLLDEPWSAVDAEGRLQLRALIRRLQREWNIPVLLVSHDAADDADADRIWQMQAGRLFAANAEASNSRGIPMIAY